MDDSGHLQIRASDGLKIAGPLPTSASNPASAWSPNAWKKIEDF